MTPPPKVTDQDFTCYTQGLLYASACTSLPDEAATDAMNTRHPSGTASGWRISSDKTFKDGTTPNGSPCPDADGRRHLLFEC